MKIYLDCYPCFLRQALQAARIAGADQRGRHEILKSALCALQDIVPGMTPPEMGETVHRAVRSVIENADPYRTLKEESTAAALELYPHLARLVRDAADPFQTAVRVSIAGNIIDHAPGHAYDLKENVERLLTSPMAVDDTAALIERSQHVGQVLFIADNAGETVFDRILIEAMGKPTIYAVKGGPILNDATREDADAAGLADVAEVVDTGSDAPGTILERCAPGFRQSFEQADLIIAKGQANYETLSTRGDRVFFLLQVKCSVIADEIGVPVGSVVVKQGIPGSHP